MTMPIFDCNQQERNWGPVWALVFLILVTSGCTDGTSGGHKPGTAPGQTSGDGSIDAAPAADTSDTGTAVPASSLGELPEAGVPFADWPKPALALFVTGRQHGYMEPCGCTGLANQKGGLARRHTLQKQLREKGWPVISLDVGNQVRRSGRQPEIKFQVTIESLKRMNYAAIGLGPDDLRLSVDELGAFTVSTEEQKSPIICANAAVYDRELTRQFHVAAVGGKKIGITAILGTVHQKKIVNDLIELTSPAAGLESVWPQLESENCDLYVLLAHTSLEESRELARQFPHFDVVVTAGGAGEPTRMPEKIPSTKSRMVQVGTKGMYVGVIGVFEDEADPIRYERVALDSQFEDSPEMMELFQAYQRQLQDLGLAGLGLRPIVHPTERAFVGSEKCSECHEEEFAIWKDGVDGQGGPHYHATESLVHPKERSTIPRHFDPECLSCHVTGWNPQGFFPYQTGYLTLADSDMHGNGCENCHGPGSRHVEAEEEDVDVERFRLEMRLTLERAKESACYECHDLDNSPDFQVQGAFERYWQQIEH